MFFFQQDKKQNPGTNDHNTQCEGSTTGALKDTLFFLTGTCINNNNNKIYKTNKRKTKMKIA